MATFKGIEATKAQAALPSLVEQGKYGAKHRRLYDKYVLTADLAASDTIEMGTPIPQGARLVDCIVTTEALGGSCTINVGWKAGAAGLEAALATGFFSALPVSSATVAKAHGSTYEGSTFYAKVLLEAVQPVIAENAVSSGATGKIIQIDIEYAID